MTEQQQAGPETGQEQEQQAEQGKRPPWGSPEEFNPEKAWDLIQKLRAEKSTPDPQLRSELDAMKKRESEQREAVARALGVKPEETSDTDKLGAQIGALQAQIVASERRAVSATTGVPENLLTATTAEEIRTQAQAFKEFAEASHAAALATQGAQQQTPAFQQIPGQGQSGQASPEAQAEAEYKAFYPDPT